MDYSSESHPPAIASVAIQRGDSLPLPPPECRPGYSPEDDEHYLRWGKSDHDLILSIIERHHGLKDGIDILDWGCSSGRVLRHFYAENRSRGWKLHGTDVQALLVEWMRRNFPAEIDVMTGSLLPHLPFRDASLDVLYGISVLTHTKYLWDMWLAEFRRVLKPGGLCIQTIQCEPAWTFYHQNRQVEWVRNALPAWLLDKPAMDEDYVFLGDGFISQTFWRESAVKKFMGRYLPVVEVLPPPQFHFQNWVIFRNA
jgi:SAM-dependent methyltransferase